jgi:hypothetical protein
LGRVVGQANGTPGPPFVFTSPIEHELGQHRVLPVGRQLQKWQPSWMPKI